MTSLKDMLLDVLPADRIIDSAHELEKLRRDICRFELGLPVLGVHPEKADEVAGVLRVAEATQTAVVPYGQRSSYWRPLEFKNAICLFAGGLVERTEEEDGRTWFGAGTSVRSLHEYFLSRGSVLGCHPDAYGDTSIGAMVATGFKSGCGMGTYSLSDVVEAVRVVGTSGVVLETGAAGPLAEIGAESFFGSSGKLGVITDVAVRPQPRCLRTLAQFSVPSSVRSAMDLIGLAQELAACPGFYETFRAVHSEPCLGEPSLLVDVIVRGPSGTSELDGRISQLLEMLGGRFPTASVELTSEGSTGPETILRWWGEEDEHWEGAGHHWYSAVDFNTDRVSARACLEIVYKGLEQATQARATSLRFGLYLAPSLVNMGFHVMYPRDGKERYEEVHPVARSLMADLAVLPVEPYGCRGRVWPSDPKGAQESTQARALKALLDPQGLLHPGAVT